MDLTPTEAILKQFHGSTSVEVLGEYAHRRGTYRVTFYDGQEVSDWNIQFDQDNGEVLTADCYNQVI